MQLYFMRRISMGILTPESEGETKGVVPAGYHRSGYCSMFFLYHTVTRYRVCRKYPHSYNKLVELI